MKNLISVEILRELKHALANHGRQKDKTIETLMEKAQVKLNQYKRNEGYSFPIATDKEYFEKISDCYAAIAILIIGLTNEIEKNKAKMIETKKDRTRYFEAIEGLRGKK
jgi:hypothetical protein